jgi:hypothetical protein
MGHLRPWRVLAVLCLSFVSIQPVAARSLEKDFAETWSARETQFATELKDDQTRYQTALSDLLADKQASSSDLMAKTTTLLQSVQIIGEAAGHADTIYHLRTFMHGKPSALKANLWLHDQGDTAKREAIAAHADIAAVQQDQNATPGDMIQRTSSALLRLSHAHGAIAELAVINDNLGQYYDAKSERDQARRQAFAAALLGLGNAIQESSRQGQNWMMTCTQMGSFTNCSGN